MSNEWVVGILLFIILIFLKPIDQVKVSKLGWNIAALLSKKLYCYITYFLQL